MPDPDDLHRLAPHVDDERAAAAFRRRRRHARFYRRGAWAASAMVLVVGASVVVTAKVGDEDTLTRTVPATTGCDAATVASGCDDDVGDAVSTTTTTASVTTTTAAPSSTTTSEASSTTTEPSLAAGSLASATVAVRAACREFYAYNPQNIDELLTPQELAAQCDAPPPEWRSDCHAERPIGFVPGDGGCAYLGGYLAVWLGEQTFADGRVFRAGDDVWTVIPESD